MGSVYFYMIICIVIFQMKFRSTYHIPPGICHVIVKCITLEKKKEGEKTIHLTSRKMEMHQWQVPTEREQMSCSTGVPTIHTTEALQTLRRSRKPVIFSGATRLQAYYILVGKNVRLTHEK